MNPFTFQTTPNVLFEAGASRKLPEIVGSFGAKRVLLVTDKGVRGAGLTKAAEAALAEAGVALDVYEDVVADPPSTVIEAEAKRARDLGTDLVLSICVGSSLDTAKLVAYLAKSDEPLDSIYGVGLAKGDRLPLILVLKGNRGGVLGLQITNVNNRAASHQGPVIQRGAGTHYAAVQLLRSLTGCAHPSS